MTDRAHRPTRFTIAFQQRSYAGFGINALERSALRTFLLHGRFSREDLRRMIRSRELIVTVHFLGGSRRSSLQTAAHPTYPSVEQLAENAKALVAQLSGRLTPKEVCDAIEEQVDRLYKMQGHPDEDALDELMSSMEEAATHHLEFGDFASTIRDEVVAAIQTFIDEKRTA